MVASRKRPKGAFRRSFGLLSFCAVMMPASVGYQDLGALIARQPAVTERGRQHVRNSTFGTIHAATFSFPRPVGTNIPEAPGYQLASLDPRALDVTGSINHRALDPVIPPAPPLEFPVVDRRLKGDLLVPRSRPAPPEPSRAKPRKQDTADVEQPAPATAPPVAPPRVAAPVAEPAKPESEPKPAPVIAAPVKPDPAPVIAEAVDAGPTPAVTAPAKPDPAPVITEPVQPEPAPVVAAPAQTEAEPPFTEVATEIAPKTTDQIATLPADSVPATKSAEELAAAELPIEGWPADDRIIATPPVAAAQAGPTMPELLTDERPDETDAAAFEPVENENPALRAARLFFGTDTMGPAQLQPWGPGEAPLLVVPRIPADPDIKLSALTPPNIFRDAPLEADPQERENKDVDSKHRDGKESTTKEGESKSNETVAAKGEVTGEGRRPKTPAERLGLTGASRVKHERCLSNAIYFEARGEAERGQMAVAQVVLNRAFSGYYPDNVCDVVYQNAHRHLACQFTFACDGIRDVVTEPDAWETAKRIARDSLDGKIWLPEIGKATHYHATYVSPWWVRTMKKHQTLGIHIFYRPKRWGDGAEAPVWGQVEVTGSVKGAKDATAPTASAAAAKL